jgi:hypothetical protein
MTDPPRARRAVCHPLSLPVYAAVAQAYQLSLALGQLGAAPWLSLHYNPYLSL